MDNVAIYTLSKEGVPFYVGRTVQDMNARFGQHKKDRFAGVDMTMEVLDVHDDVEDQQFNEAYWIYQLSSWGFNLENLQFNGFINNKHSKEIRKNISKNLSSYYSSLSTSEKTELYSSRRGRKTSEEQKEKQRKSMKAHVRTKEHCENIRKSRIGKKHSDEAKANMSKSSKGQIAWNRKLTDDQVRSMKAMLKDNVMHKNIAPKFNVSLAVVKKISQGKNYKNIV